MIRSQYWLFLTIFIVGCATTEKKAKDYYLQNKDKLAKLCSDCFPVKEEFKQGKEVYLPSDTVFIKGDSVFVEGDCPDGTKTKVKCPPSDTMKVYIPILRIDTLVRPDSAAIYYWQSEYKDLDVAKKQVEVKSAEQQEDIKFWRKWALILGGIILVRMGWWAFKLYFKKGIV